MTDSKPERGARRKPTRRDLLVIIGRLQGMIGAAKGIHQDDRHPDGFALGQRTLDRAEEWCIKALSYDPPIQKRFGPWGKWSRDE